MTAEARLMCDLARSLFARGLTPGSSGNLSMRLPDGGCLVTPTNASLGRLDPSRLSRLDASWSHVAGDPPTKELPLHRAFHETRAQTGAVAHLHSHFAVALSCLDGLDPDDALAPALTPYPVMRLGRVALLPYLPPGDPGMGAQVAALGGRAKAVLLQSHGPVVADRTLEAAVAALEELEEAARLRFTLGALPARRLTPGDLATLAARFPP